ncbi:rotamase-domain-containing protein [Filobasidium floriforme]|uniref:rotamase-domain-containing protein n=1 Tax=Filobasidium floriforme TaxID=5210 RepID=UPI001E8CAA37|nr:rotamase-domain-containing protein [Filobasidium floriforme]KAH8088068.1 rotamase-domain-containing protein [Filobasidium floriforme]
MSAKAPEIIYEVRWSQSKNLPYYFNTQTNQSDWSAPLGYSQAEIDTWPGAKEYLGQKVNDGKVRASHLLIKHSGSRRPASWKNPNITTPKSSAISLLQSYEAQLVQTAQQNPEKLGEEFAKLAARESDCASHAKGGDLGWFARGNMQKPFEDATFALEPGQMSSIVDTDSGVHLILRTA